MLLFSLDPADPSPQMVVTTSDFSDLDKYNNRRFLRKNIVAV